MTSERDIERVLDHWFTERPTQVPDRVLDEVADRIAGQRQRPAWRLLWRETDMHPMVKYGAAIAAVLVIAVIGWNLLPGGSSSIGGQPTASPSPTATPTSTPTATVPPLPEGTLAAGTYRLRPFATLTIDATVPEGGWGGGPPNGLGGPSGSNGPNGLGIGFLQAQTINSDPCHWDKDGSGSAPQQGDIEVGPTVDDLAEALAAGSAYESTTPVDATLGGFSGKRLELQLVPDASGCDNFEGDENQYFVFGGREGGLFAQGGANTWQITILDVAGTRLIVVLFSYEDTPSADLSAAQAILDSLVITP
jgi:hypothetical protein